MTTYQCPDCLGVHEEATEPVLGLFVRCEACLMEASLGSETFGDEVMHQPEPAAARAA
jgi:hypothetical protein